MAENALPELPYERIAMAGGEMPDDLEWYDRQLFLMLRTLYWQYKQGIVDRETASREKTEISNFSKTTSQRTLQRRLWKQNKHGRNTEKTEPLKTQMQ